MFYGKRGRFKKYEDLIGKNFAKLGLSPNQWTIVSLILGFAAFYSVMTMNFIEAAVIIIITAFLDVVDGCVARTTGKVSKKGAYLDTIIDRYVEFLIIFGLFFVPLQGLWLPFQAWLFIYLFGAMMTTYAKSAAKEKELIKDELKGGILERAERMMILFLGIVLAAFSIQLLVYIIALLAILSNLSAFQRINKVWKNKKS
ncbi:MAG: CDP-alcohol phosphatidyltransferase family protein [Candidatus Aenigmarchaeota archaeon]|nr:CDP-alcohol phosphatidyltransferase family protein [Candidatus Aenigmarchaeota archaeon]